MATATVVGISFDPAVMDGTFKIDLQISFSGVVGVRSAETRDHQASQVYQAIEEAIVAEQKRINKIRDDNNLVPQDFNYPWPISKA